MFRAVTFQREGNNFNHRTTMRPNSWVCGFLQLLKYLEKLMCGEQVNFTQKGRMLKGVCMWRAPHVGYLYMGYIKNMQVKLVTPNCH